ncbi:MAG: DUF5985 family protein [Rhodospirillaceae bacterium]
MDKLESAVYLLCMITSLICLLLLVRGYLKTRVKLLLWCALGFVGFAANNFFLFLDTVMFPDVDLMPARIITAFAAVAVLFYGLTWEVD